MNRANSVVLLWVATAAEVVAAVSVGKLVAVIGGALPQGYAIGTVLND